jgi:hypothetical protein
MSVHLGENPAAEVHIFPEMSPEEPSAPSPIAAASLVPSIFDTMDCQLFTPGTVCESQVVPPLSDTHICPVLFGRSVLPPSTAATADPVLLMVTDLQLVGVPPLRFVCSLQVAPESMESQTLPPGPGPYPSHAIWNWKSWLHAMALHCPFGASFRWTKVPPLLADVYICVVLQTATLAPSDLQHIPVHSA